MAAAKKIKSKSMPVTAHSHSHSCNGLGINEVALQKVLAKAKKPLSAYDLIPLMSKQEKRVIAPVTVYRALKHLMSHGIVTRIESKNAYILCQHPHETHDCLFFICRACGDAIEAPDNKISKLLRGEATALGFKIDRQIIEIVGLCDACVRD